MFPGGNEMRLKMVPYGRILGLPDSTFTMAEFNSSSDFLALITALQSGNTPQRLAALPIRPGVPPPEDHFLCFIQSQFMMNGLSLAYNEVTKFIGTMQTTFSAVIRISRAGKFIYVYVLPLQPSQGYFGIEWPLCVIGRDKAHEIEFKWIENNRLVLAAERVPRPIKKVFATIMVMGGTVEKEIRK